MADDSVQPVHMAQSVLGAWAEVGLTRDDWLHCRATVEPRLAGAFNEACHLANAWLLQQGVLPHIDLRALVRRGRDGVSPAAQPAAAPAHNAPTAGGAPSTSDWRSPSCRPCCAPGR